jgi:hypothetical protein
VAQDDDLDRQVILSAAQEADELDHADEGQVEERESHGGILAARTALPKVLVSAAGDLLGTHRLPTCSMNCLRVRATAELLIASTGSADVTR